MPDRLFHFTCVDHGYAGIGKRGELLPNLHPMLGHRDWPEVRLVWMTDQEWPDREATGLMQVITRCDRMAYRYVITDLSNCEPWVHSRARLESDWKVVVDLEAFGHPREWWISYVPVPARLG